MRWHLRVREIEDEGKNENASSDSNSHLHQAGLSRQNWNNLFNIGRGQPSTSLIAKEYIRAYALDQQVPLAKQSAFLWVDAFVPNLEITGSINTDVYDGSAPDPGFSGLLHLENLDHRGSVQCECGLKALRFRGPPTERGCASQAGAVLLTRRSPLLFGCQLETATAAELRSPFRSCAAGLADFWVQDWVQLKL